MRAYLREGALWALPAAAAAAALGWLGTQEFGWNDYDKEAHAAVAALVHGHIAAFFRLAPVYGGSLLERAPFALMPGIWGGGELAVYRMLALPCLLVALALGLWLISWMRRNGRSVASRALVLTLCAANPLTLLALEIGHPDELLGGALCVAAVLLAARGRGVWAGIALGLAIANKQWALIAIAPVLLALPRRHLSFLASTAATSAAFMAPFALSSPGTFASNVNAAASTGVTFQPWQIWWFIGHHVHTSGLTGAAAAAAPPAGYRVGPLWVSSISHPLIVAIVLPLTLALWWRRRPTPSAAPRAAGGREPAHRRLAQRLQVRLSAADSLLFLALLLLLRCMLDPWDNVYYPIPFVLALLGWETFSRSSPALLASLSTLAVLINHHWMATVASPDAQAIAFLAWTVPLLLHLALRLYAPGRAAVVHDDPVAEPGTARPRLAAAPAPSTAAPAPSTAAPAPSTAALP